MQVFAPAGNTVAINVGTTSARKALTDLGYDEVGNEVRVANPGDAVIFVAFGDAFVVAVAPTDATANNGLPIMPGSVEAFRLPGSVTHAAAIMATGSGILYFTSGVGA
ncbi:hypothetical protein [Microcystis phage Mwe-JY08]